MQQRTHQAIRIGQFAANLFGSETANDKKPIVSKPYATRAVRKLNEPRTRMERVIFPELITNLNPTAAVIGIINDIAFRDTMDNFRMYAAFYNKKIKETNAKTLSDAKIIDVKIKNKEFTEIQITYSAIFYQKNAKLSAIEFNQQANIFNTEYGLTLKLKKLQTLKYAQQLSFQQMLYDYRKQLDKEAAISLKINPSKCVQISQMEINAARLTKQLRNGDTALDISKNTIRRHRKQFEEAGILVQYLFRGHKYAVKSSINPEILVVFDIKAQNLVGVVNQRFNIQTHTKCLHKEEVQKQIKINIKKEVFGQSEILKGTASPIIFYSFLQKHPLQNNQKISHGPPENVKVSEKVQKNTEILRSTILHPQDLAVRLSNGYFFNYTPIDNRYMHMESMYGTMLRPEFNELCINEAFKYASKIYRNSNAFVGSWKNAINLYIEKWFAVNNGTISMVNKQLMFDKLIEFKWRINHAQRWFTKSGVKPLFPSDYFDFTRTTKREIGFEFTKKAYQKHLETIANTEKRKIALVKKTEARKIRNNFGIKYENAIKSFLGNKLSLGDLIELVSKNLPLQYSQKLAESIKVMQQKKVA